MKSLKRGRTIVLNHQGWSLQKSNWMLGLGSGLSHQTYSSDIRAWVRFPVLGLLPFKPDYIAEGCLFRDRNVASILAIPCGPIVARSNGRTTYADHKFRNFAYQLFRTVTNLDAMDIDFPCSCLPLSVMEQQWHTFWIVQVTNHRNHALIQTYWSVVVDRYFAVGQRALEAVSMKDGSAPKSLSCSFLTQTHHIEAIASLSSEFCQSEVVERR